ncbi:MAG: hypothetical protein K8H88_08880 [Sandaracinaceae bacterium]|nr:hypothetical protein [Sandaracinaceae bacterium]
MGNESFSRGARLLMIGLATVLALAACGRRARVVIDPRTGQQVVIDRRSEQYTRNLIALAARDSGCPAPGLTPIQIHPEVYSVTGCAVPYEYWLQCGRRGRCSWRRLGTLNEAAAGATQCPPEMIQQVPTQDPSVRQVAGCGHSSVFAMMCSAAGAGCGWVLRGTAPSAPVVVAQGQIPQAQPPQPQQPQVLVVPAPPQAQAPQQPAPSASVVVSIEAQIRAQREALLSCVPDGRLDLTVRWSSNGQVILQLPPALTGTPAEGCVQAVVGTLRVQASAPGQTVVAVQ